MMDVMLKQILTTNILDSIMMMMPLSKILRNFSHYVNNIVLPKHYRTPDLSYSGIIVLPIIRTSHVLCKILICRTLCHNNVLNAEKESKVIYARALRKQKAGEKRTFDIYSANFQINLVV